MSAETKMHKPIPVAGYKSQSDATIALVNRNKEIEEQILKIIDDLEHDHHIDRRWLAIGRTHLELAFMAINRSIFQPVRI